MSKEHVFYLLRADHNKSTFRLQDPALPAERFERIYNNCSSCLRMYNVHIALSRVHCTECDMYNMRTMVSEMTDISWYCIERRSRIPAGVFVIHIASKGSSSLFERYLSCPQCRCLTSYGFSTYMQSSGKCENCMGGGQNR